MTKDREGVFTETISKEVFFYSTLFLFVVANILIVSLSRVLETIPAVSSASGTPKFFNSGSKNAIIAWIKSFGFVINALFIFSLIYIGMLNNIENFQRSDFNFLFYLGPILVVIWLIALIGILSKKYDHYDN